MGLLFDTNILVAIVRAANHPDLIRFLNPNSRQVYISIVSEGEIKCLALQNKWGLNKIRILERLLDEMIVTDITNIAINTYSQIDSFSQLRNPGFKNYPFKTPRNMGKNDLWISSYAALINLTLVTTDSDFDHLHDIFIDVRKIHPSDFLPFFTNN
ncbi:type II toxin-antitoxin system VapC family toxin [Dyadobacter sp. CY327]|uniref:type II toxin-antitoxin system VapC family toxin n=1 Tax=Dyadobacter sp. CY327 TaxID=2907301 RepID=UPI001F3F6D89|nr:type II toxin-antitoxin system VapC family toxin [Dyadobacter sp. CY327]MCE7073275.1 type II toxin-antitoxin system VapC family toxin [Dyadobacter sp. CY327]